MKKVDTTKASSWKAFIDYIEQTDKCSIEFIYALLANKNNFVKLGKLYKHQIAHHKRKNAVLKAIVGIQCPQDHTIESIDIAIHL